MAATSSLADKAYKAIAALCAGATVVGLSTLVVNVYCNTGKHEKPNLDAPASDGTIDSSMQSKPA